MTSCLQAALDALGAGISVWPPRQDGSKAPDGAWKIGQAERAHEVRIMGWYRDGRTGVGWVTGAVSGNLEVLDFDDRSTWAEFQKIARDAGLGELLDRVSAGYLEHTPNGAHLVYRCSEIAGNQKLAQNKDLKSLIETRGEGGYIIVAPSHGGVNLKGVYTLASGGVRTIVTITPEERRNLFDVARIFDEAPRPVEAPRHAPSGDRPGDDYNARATWPDVLEPHGWVKVGTRLGVTSWRRPGKDHGISATTNHADTDLLYVFSTSTGFDANRGHSKFSAYCILNHHGNFSAAAHDVKLQGYGIVAPEEASEVDLSLLLAGLGKAKAPVIDDLLRVPGLVGELAEWINQISHRPQPVLALGASIAAMATVLGRRVRTETDLRSNIYVLGVGETGCGKERARQAVNRLFTEIGAGKALGDSFASDSAVERAVILSPSCLYLIDELGHFLGTVKDTATPGYVRNIIQVFLKLYTSSEGTYRRKLYATEPQKGNKEPVEVEQPCLSIYGTTVPANLYGSLTKSQLSDGFVSRLLVLESSDPDPELRWVDAESNAIPAGLVEGFRHWWSASINTTSAGNLEARTIPSPRAVRATQGARDIYTDLEGTMRRRRAEERHAGRDQGPYTRVGAAAQKLALIRACGVNLDEPEITEADAQWGASLAWSLTEAFVTKINSTVSENKTEEHTLRVLALIKSRGTISKNELTRRTQAIKPTERREILSTLIDGGQVVEVITPTDKRQRTEYKAV